METAKEQVIREPAVSVIVPVRDRWGPRLRNCVKSLELQTLQPLEIIVADYGSTEQGHEAIMKTLEDFNCSVYYYPTDDIWNLSLARNMGIRRSDSRCKIVTVVDADLILASRVMEVLVGAHFSRPQSYISCFVRMLLPSGLSDLDADAVALQFPECYTKLRALKYWSSSGWGGLVSAPRNWLFKVRGFDERMKLWGAEDSDLWKRAGLDGMDRYRLNDVKMEDIEIYHQFHSDSLSWNQDELIVEELNRIIWNKEMRARDYTVMRNNENWGLWRLVSKGDGFIYD